MIFKKARNFVKKRKKIFKKIKGEKATKFEEKKQRKLIIEINLKKEENWFKIFIKKARKFVKKIKKKENLLKIKINKKK